MKRRKAPSLFNASDMVDTPHGMAEVMARFNKTDPDREEDELRSDKEYMDCIHPPYSFQYRYLGIQHQRRMHPLATYAGPMSLNSRSRDIIKARYQKSLSLDAFPPNIVVNRADTTYNLYHRRLERSNDTKAWETPVPRLSKSNNVIPLNDGGKVHIMCVVCILSHTILMFFCVSL